MKYKRFFILKVIILIFLIITPIATKAAGQTPLDQAKNIIVNKYINDVSGYVLQAQNIGDLIGRLNDKNCYYYTANEYLNYQKSLLEDITGIGVVLEKCPQGAKVLYLPNNTPAYISGIRKNDIIISINSIPLNNLSITDVYKMLKGIEGTKVTLAVSFNDNVKDFTIERKTMDYPTVYGENKNNIGYIKITNFTNTTADEFNALYNNLDANSPKGYILDLRDNSGENICSALEICGHFIGNNVGTVVQANGHITQKINCPAEVNLINKPVVVIINKGTSKAAEVLTSALRDYKKVIFIGENTAGNTTEEELFRLDDGSYMKITTKKYLSPFSNIIDNNGIKPDFNIKEENDISTALLLLSNGDLKDKNYALIDVKDVITCISTDEASKFENWNLFKEVANQACKNYILKLYSGNYGKVISNTDLNKLYSLYFPNYKEFVPLSDVSPTKEFKVTFSTGIDFSTITNKSIEIINIDNGERKELIFNKVSDNIVTINVLGRLNDDGNYILVIHDELIKDLKSRILKQGAICLIHVR